MDQLIAIPITSMRDFSRINRHYDDSVPLAKPKNRWWDRAKCRGKDTNIFFPEAEGFHQPFYVLYEEAEAICKRCPVRTECLNAAIEEEGSNAEGMRGGVDHRVRRRLWMERTHKSRKRYKTTN